MGLRRKNVSFFTNNRYDPETGCWNWTGGLSYAGYGTIYYLGRQQGVHRVSAHCYLGFDLNSDLWVLHKCDNPSCFNPKHLFIGTPSDNQKDSVNKARQRNARKTHCDSGHPLSGKNLHILPDGSRRCRTCNGRVSRERYRAKAGPEKPNHVGPRRA